MCGTNPELIQRPALMLQLTVSCTCLVRRARSLKVMLKVVFKIPAVTALGPMI